MRSETASFAFADSQEVILPRYVAGIRFASENLILDSSCEVTNKGAAYWETSTNELVGEYEGRVCCRLNASSAIVDQYNRTGSGQNYIPTKQGEIFDVSADVFVSSDATIGSEFALASTEYDSGFVVTGGFPSKNVTVTAEDRGVWQTITGTFIVTFPNAAYLSYRNSIRPSMTAGYVLFDNVKVTRRNGSLQDASSDITYVTSHSDAQVPPGTNSIDRIDAAIISISGQSQRITPDAAQHSIGGITIKMLDVNGELSTKIYDKLEGDEGLRKKRIELYKGHESLTSWDDYSLRLTYLIEGVSYKDGVYTFKCSDIQRSAKNKIMDVQQGVLTSTLAKGAMTIPVTIADYAEKYPLVYHDEKYTSQPSQAIGYVKIEDEIIAHSGWNVAGTELIVVQRGAMSTLDVEHTIDPASETEQKKIVEEYVYLRSQTPRMAYGLYTGIDSGGKNLLAAPFDLLIANPDWDTGADSITVSESSENSPADGIKLYTVDDQSTGYAFLQS
ncbi:MAG: hypothetical protein QNJ78_06420, partial [Gammaproteobacteria bacterium]|nr:hypothetical protein [Gammaproteobacteria bacterium]